MIEIGITPRLVVHDVRGALEFYQAALGAEITHGPVEASGHVVHAAVRIANAALTLTEERRGWGNAAPDPSRDSPVILNLTVPDADAVGASLRAHGATELIAIGDRFYGVREGRFRDPFGHLWIVTDTCPVSEGPSPQNADAPA